MFVVSTKLIQRQGGVYKGQGRIQRALLTRIYKGFLVHDSDYNCQSQLR